MKYLKNILIYIVLTVVIVGVIGFFKKPNEHVGNEDDARKAFVGTWTYTEPINTSADVFPFNWVKYEISSNGTLAAYNAQPTDNDWGKGVTCPLKIETGKFSDTGERWYGIRECGNAVVATYQEGHLVLRLGSYKTSGKMQRTDAFPFSK